MDSDRVAGEKARRNSETEEQRPSRSPSDNSSANTNNASPKPSASAPERPQSPEYTKRPRTEASHTSPTGDAPLPYDEEPPPLPDEAPPENDGWEPRWDPGQGAWYFYNNFTHVSQWENPRVPEATAYEYGSYDRSAAYAAPGISNTVGAPGTSNTIGAPGTTNTAGAPGTSSPPKRRAGGYNPAIHGNYDPNADYAIEARKQEEEEEAAQVSANALAAGLPDPNQDYSATGHFNRFTGRYQASGVNPENHNDEAKSRRQMNAFFDVDAAANSHDGRSLKAERRNKQLSKKELKAYKDKRKEKKMEKRRAWLLD